MRALTSYIATGTSLGFGEFGGTADFTIFAKAPGKRTTLINYKDHPDRGESLWTVNGPTGTVKTPRALLRDYTIVGEELDGQQGLQRRSGERPERLPGHVVLRPGSRPAGPDGPLWFVASRPRAHADRLRGL